MSLRNKKILITAGPTWVPIDKIRIISNISTGKTGILLAKQARSLGAKVTLLLGPVYNFFPNKQIKTIPFRYFEQFQRLLKKELKSKKYDIAIHSAAVSNYKPKNKYMTKLKSDLDNFTLPLRPTEKIVDRIKKYDSKVFLVVFKLEVNVNKNTLFKRTLKILKRTNADLAVANIYNDKGYRAFILDGEKVLKYVRSKEELSKRLFKVIESKYVGN